MKTMMVKKSHLENLLPYDGEVYYVDHFMDPDSAFEFYETLNREIEWQNDEFLIYGKRIIMNRQMAWYGDQSFTYTYAGLSKIAIHWNRTLAQIKEEIEGFVGESFNSCLLNLYPKGSDGMGWHSDNEKELYPHATIASLSLGAERKFSFKHRLSKETISLNLAHGSLLLMRGEIQQHWLHQLPKTRKQLASRINLTFRTFADVTPS
jgi:alkylated DNA repair dioxygenase AlkB